jgi:hypothetical protein
MLAVFPVEPWTVPRLAEYHQLSERKSRSWLKQAQLAPRPSNQQLYVLFPACSLWRERPARRVEKLQFGSAVLNENF